MRWLYHLLPRRSVRLTAPLAPPSLAAEGFVHASFRDDVLESARLHFAPGEDLVALQIDPRRLDVRVELAATPRGPMPHVHGPVPADAVRGVVELSAIASAPDRVEGADDERGSRAGERRPAQR